MPCPLLITTYRNSDYGLRVVDHITVHFELIDPGRCFGRHIENVVEISGIRYPRGRHEERSKYVDPWCAYVSVCVYTYYIPTLRECAWKGGMEAIKLLFFILTGTKDSS